MEKNSEKKNQKLAVKVKKKVVKKKKLSDALRKNLLRRKAAPDLQDWEDASYTLFCKPSKASNLLNVLNAAWIRFLKKDKD